MRQRERLERLHLQAYQDVLQNSDVFVKDFVISYNKVRVVFALKILKIMEISLSLSIAPSIGSRAAGNGGVERESFPSDAADMQISYLLISHLHCGEESKSFSANFFIR